MLGQKQLEIFINFFKISFTFFAPGSICIFASFVVLFPFRKFPFMIITINITIYKNNFRIRINSIFLVCFQQRFRAFRSIFFSHFFMSCFLYCLFFSIFSPFFAFFNSDFLFFEAFHFRQNFHFADW